MNILVIGGGGREHALAWKIAQSDKVTQVLVAPGNAGTATEPKCRNVNVAAEDLPALLELAKREAIDFTVVGPEAPLAAGIVDLFSENGLKAFGPNKKAAQLEASKAFAKAFLDKHGIPTAKSKTHTDMAAALTDVRERGAPIVVKADGLAAGKGVVVATTLKEAEDAITDMLGDNRFGDAGSRVVVEDFLDGEEASFIMVVSGEDHVDFPTSQDHKRIGDGDSGPNTGGMGAYSPAPVVNDLVMQRVQEEVVKPTLAGLKKDGIDFVGFLYAGLMIDAHGTPRVLEFNCRMGDPETQPLLMRLESDLLDILMAAVDRTLAGVEAKISAQMTLGVVMAAAGYPAAVAKGDTINGLDSTFSHGSKVFHAGTKKTENGIVTSGGRVLCVVGSGDTIEQAQQRAYNAVSKISWNGEQHRSDIGYRAINRG